MCLAQGHNAVTPVRLEPAASLYRKKKQSEVFMNICIVANRQHASTYSPVAFRSVHTGIEPSFLLKNILCDYCLHDSGFYIQKILTKREMINCQKNNFLLFLTINSVTTGVRELNGTSQISLVTHDAKGEMREI